MHFQFDNEGFLNAPKVSSATTLSCNDSIIRSQSIQDLNVLTPSTIGLGSSVVQRIVVKVE